MNDLHRTQHMADPAFDTLEDEATTIESRIVYLVQPFSGEGVEERRGTMERCGTLDKAQRFAGFLATIGMGAVLWAVVVTGGITDNSTLTEIGRFHAPTVLHS
jgi:hypothetical protein